VIEEVVAVPDDIEPPPEAREGYEFTGGPEGTDCSIRNGMRAKCADELCCARVLEQLSSRLAGEVCHKRETTNQAFQGKNYII
jgi:hypothetical protein